MNLGSLDKMTTEKADASIIPIHDDISAAEEARWSRQSIYRIPASVTVTAVNPRVYKPQTVSIGPYHYGTENLQAMKEHKLRARRHFLHRTGKPLQCLHQELRPVAQHLKDAYNQLDEVWLQDTEAFLELMVMDGCFVLELLRTTTTGQAEGYSENDPIFSKHGRLNNVPYLRCDMLMLENQIPMGVLQRLYSLDPLKKESGSCSNELTKRILNFFSLEPRGNVNELSKCLHILDLYRKSLIFYTAKAKKLPGSDIKFPTDDIIRSATELHEAGITIKKSKTKSLKDISFSRGLFRGVLRLPLTMVDDSFESTYLNLIAFERFHAGVGNDVTSYIFFMDSIIDSVQDVSLLHRGGVIQNALGSDEAVAKLFNSLSTNSALDPDSSLGKVHSEVSRYCHKRCHRWRAYCCHHYFTNPWVAVTVVAAIFIFVITILQTVYTVLTYHKPPPSS